MSLKNFTKKELEDKFENFLFSVDDFTDAIVTNSEEQGFNLNFTLNSLNDLEKYLKINKFQPKDDAINDAAAYFGEVFIKNIGGIWECSLDEKNNSIYYGKPVITKYTIPHDLQLSPFDCILNFISSPEKNYFIKIIENEIDDVPLNLDDLPTEV